MGKYARKLAVGAALLGTTAAVAAGATAVGATTKGRSDSGTAYISIVRQHGGLLYAAGYNVDKLFGATGVTYVVSVGSGKPGTFNIKAKTVTLYTSTGALTGTGSATQVVSSSGAATIKNGKLKLTRGSGAQAHHSVTATFTGTFDPNTSVYTFHYSGTYR